MTTNTANDQCFFTQTVPVFLDFASRIVDIATLAHVHQRISTRLVADTFSVGEHLVIAQGFALRTIFPVIGQTCPDLSTEEPGYRAIGQRHAELIELLLRLDRQHFTGAASRTITHEAGDARLTQSAADYVRLFGVLNYFFHLSMAYATLRAAGVPVGKAQFDGLHDYAPNFSFQGE